MSPLDKSGTCPHNAARHYYRGCNVEALSKDLSASKATVDGLEELFDTDSADVTPVTSDTGSTEEITADSVSLWTLQETAEKLGVSTRTILRKLKTGSICGHKIMGTNGPEWRITPIDTPDLTERTVTPLVESVSSDNATNHDTTIDSTTVALLKVIESQAEQLKAATSVILYQQDQLSEKDKEIKLLTDSKQKRGAWSRFWSWFAGR